MMGYKNKKYYIIMGLLSLSVTPTYALYIQDNTGTNNTGDIQITSEPQQLTLSEQLLQNKSTLENTLANIYNTLYNDYQSKVAEYNDLPNYQSLVCLGIIEEDNILEQLGQEIELIRTSILNDYVDINADIFNLMNKYSVGLIDDLDFDTEKNKLELNIDSYASNYSTLLEELSQKYNDQINNLSNTLQGYIEQNKDLLKNLNNKIIAIQNIKDSRKQLQNLIFQINNSINIDQDKFMQDLQKHTSESIEQLSKALDNTINSYLQKYPYINNLKSVLIQQKENIIKAYNYDIDSELNQVFGQWYDQSEYVAIKEQVESLDTNFYLGDQLSCKKVISTSLDLDGYIDLLQNKINNFNTKLENGLKILSQTGADIQFKKDILTKAQNIYNQGFTKNLSSFKEFTESYIKDKNQRYEYLYKNIKFDRAFEEGEYDETIKTLQALLLQLGYYQGEINGIYDSVTKQAVYKLQLEGDLLKGYENKPEVFGYFGPATRAYAQQRLEQVKELLQTSADESITSKDTTINPNNTNDTSIVNQKILSALYKLEKKFNSKQTYIYLLNALLNKINEELDSQTLSTNKSKLYQSFKVSIQIYLNENQ